MRKREKCCGNAWIGLVLPMVLGMTGMGMSASWGAEIEAPILLAQAESRDGEEWLARYEESWGSLPPLPNLQFRQQVRMSGTQEFTATLDVLYRQDGSWQVWLGEGDRIRLLDSRDLEVVNQSDILRMYSVYTTRPNALMPEVGFDVSAPEGRYAVQSVTEVLLSGERRAMHLVLEPSGAGQLREIWLDPETGLPHQSLLFLSGIWGQAFALLEFAAVEDYWLPSSAQINAGYGFWTLDGLSRRVLRGSLMISHEYQDYQVLPAGEELRFAASKPPVDQPPTLMGVPGESRLIQSGDVQALGANAEGNQEFSIGLGRDELEPIDERILAFNLTRPASRNALTQIDTLASLSLGGDTLPVYLFQFDTERPLSPIQGSAAPSVDPNDVFRERTRVIRLLGN